MKKMEFLRYAVLELTKLSAKLYSEQKLSRFSIVSERTKAKIRMNTGFTKVDIKLYFTGKVIIREYNAFDEYKDYTYYEWRADSDHADIVKSLKKDVPKYLLSIMDGICDAFQPLEYRAKEV